ncbi:MAG: hypothetical protein A2X86_08570 [Bdellovibrionales bacterium GWA2_49_15]|nr:MAG: hypothetical protein A2X86_08570 [Bdellovibrionales bacterium GWA2_49_15]HAZ11184.1 hypothetical protein [Bdellovibrionales bacterium]
MSDNIPAKPANSARIVVTLDYPESRLDNILLKTLREQNDNMGLKNLSRAGLKKLFSKGSILIKGQRAKPSSSLAKGTTYIDILGA